jgi:hypothetical protein
MQNDTLFVYFCGTEEETGKHITRFMPAIAAKYHFYINGVASSRTDFQKLEPVLLKDFTAAAKTPGWTLRFPAYQSGYTNRITDLKVSKIAGASNSQACSFVYTVDGNQKQVYTLEKQYDGYRMASVKGYSENDILKVVRYSLERLLNILQVHKEIKKVVLSGHSRGAAVGLSSFLYYLLDELDKTRNGDQLNARKALKSLDKLDILFLDPVAGQRGSANYCRIRHKRDWTTADLYHLLNEELPNLNSITEIYANAAQMVGKYVYGLRSFNPSKSFLEDFQLEKGNLFKLFLGFSHSALVNPFDSKGLPYVYDRILHYKKIKEYEGDFVLSLFERLENRKRPFDLIVGWINDYHHYTQGSAQNARHYTERYKAFADSDGIFAQLIAQYNDPEIKVNKHHYKDKERTEYDILNDIFPKKEVVDQILTYLQLRRDAFYVNRRGEKTSLAELVENNALSFGVTPDGTFELGDVARQYVEDNDDLSALLNQLMEEVDEEETKEVRHIEAERKKEKRKEDQKRIATKEEDDEDDDVVNDKPSGGKLSKPDRRRDEEDDEDEDEDDDKKDKRSDREKTEDERATRAKKRRDAIKDLLAATGGNIPDFYNEVSKELRKQMSVENKLAFDPPGYLKFDDGVFRTPDLASANLSKATDFYALSQAEQKLLYDRVGLFKGIVIDHSKDAPVQQGFRDVLKREKTLPPKGLPAEEHTDVVRVMFKRPRLSGFYESTYTFDESERKSQETGVFSLGFGLAVNYSSFKVGVGVRAGFNYGHQHMQQKSVHSKRMEVVSSFFLPKIDLSFDALRPCAADDFVDAVTQALKADAGATHPFLRLCKVLQHYGHFVPLNLLIGGRLYSVNTKEIKEEKDIHNTLTEYNAKLQVAVETMTTDVGLESKMAKTDANQTADMTKTEAQSLRLTAVGGEGAYVNNTTKWVESMAHFSQWGLVKFDDLIPSIHVLPPALRHRCGDAILDYVKGSTIDDLLRIGADFLFYNGYMEEFGSKATPKFFRIQNIQSGKVLAIENRHMANATPVTMGAIEGSDAQLWWLNASGKLLSKKGYFGQEVYALTAQGSSLVITQNNFFTGQYWELGGGMIRNLEVDAGLQILDSGKASERVALAKVDAKNREFTGWRIIAAAQVQASSGTGSKPELIENNADVMAANQYLTAKRSMAARSGQVVMTLDEKGLEIKYKKSKTTLWQKPLQGCKELAISDGKLVLVYDKSETELDQELVLFDDPNKPANSLELLDNGNLELLDIDGRLVWQSESFFYSVIRAEGNEGVLSLYHSDYTPSMDRDNLQAMLMPYVEADHQLWYVSRHGQLVNKLKRNGTASFALACNEHGAVSLKPLSDYDTEQRWLLGDGGSGAIVNQHHNRRLEHTAHGKPLTASADIKAIWKVVPEAKNHGKSRKMTMKVREMGPTENFHYKEYYKITRGNKDQHGMWHKGKFKVVQNLETVSLFEQYGAVALSGTFRDTSGTMGRNNTDVDEKMLMVKPLQHFYIDKSPIYLPQRNELTLGFYEKDNRMAIFVEDKAGHQHKNEDFHDKNYFTLGENCGIMNMGGVVTGEDEVLVGVGLTQVGRSFVTYTMVIPK